MTAAGERPRPAIGARLDRIGPSRSIWILVILISFGYFFEGYALLSSGYIAPGIIRSGIITATTTSFFGLTGFASFVAATFAGFLVGTLCCSFLADRLGRRSVFTYALLFSSAASAVMAFQDTANGLNVWRFVSGIGIGIEAVTIDAYLSELVPKNLRGRAFALCAVITFAAAPVAALLAWWLVPLAPFGLDGWRWVVLAGCIGGVVIWPMRIRLPESPRWLEARGSMAEAEAIVADLEERFRRDTGQALPPPEEGPGDEIKPGRYREIWGPAYIKRTVMLCIFNVFQSVGLYGFANWVPTFLVQQGISVTHSLGYTLGMALAAPFGPLAAMLFADRFERKWQIVTSALIIAAAGLIFAQLRDPLLIVPTGAIVTLTSSVLGYCFHAYQAELYPTRIRAQAVGFVYSWSRVSGAFSGFLIAFILGRYGVPSAFLLIAGSMGMVALSIGLLGPNTTRRSLEALAR